MKSAKARNQKTAQPELAAPLTHIPGKYFQSFLNAPTVADLRHWPEPMPRAAVIGVPYAMPYAMGQSRSAGAPAYLREKSLRFVKTAQPCRNFDYAAAPMDLSHIHLIDCGDVPFDPLDIPAGVARSTAAISAILARGAVPLIFGGDDAVPIPALRAFEHHGPITVIQIDEHLDWAREIHGITDGYSSPMRNAAAMPWVEQTVQLGLHGFGLAEHYEDARRAGNILITENEIHKQGIASALRRIPDGRKYVISLDVDGLDASICPAVSHPEPGGLNFHEANDLLTGLARQGTIAGLIVAELVPEHDVHGLGGHTLSRLVVNLLHALATRGP